MDFRVHPRRVGPGQDEVASLSLEEWKLLPNGFFLSNLDRISISILFEAYLGKLSESLRLCLIKGFGFWEVGRFVVGSGV